MQLSHNTVAIITGASSGIGRATALELARRGASVALIARRADRIEEVAAQARELGVRALPLLCDITSQPAVQSAVDAVVKEFGRVDVLVNNAGRGHFSYIEDTPAEQVESIFRVNVFSLWYTTPPVLRLMRRQNSGHIINISSLAGRIGYPANAAYVAAKHAVVGFNRALRSELAGTDIEATVVVPAGVLTEWTAVTEGGAIGGLFDYEGRRGAEIARERSVAPAPAFPLLMPEEVAAKIVDAVGTPVAELHTHPGTREFVMAFEQDPAGIEHLLEPFRLANREGYVRMRNEE